MDISPNSLREKQKRQTRAEIVRAAFELFAKHGYENVPVEKIAQAAGVSRATFFNYFPRKDLLLREIAGSRLERLKGMVARLGKSSKPKSFSDIVALFSEIALENTRITGVSRQLMIEIIQLQSSNGPFMTNRNEAIRVLAGLIQSISGKRKLPSRLAAETLFAIYIGTMLEWFVRKDEPAAWLPDNMRARLELAVKGMA